MKTLIATMIFAAFGAAAIATGAEAAQGCGHGWHWSYRWNHCVRDAAIVVPRDCPYHWHWSNHWGHCVHN